MDKTTFQQGMAYLAAGFGIELTRERAAVYLDQLGGLRDDAFLVACKVAVGNCERFPSVARLRELYQDELRRNAMHSARRLERRDPASANKVRAMIRQLRERVRP